MRGLCQHGRQCEFTEHRDESGCSTDLVMSPDIEQPQQHAAAGGGAVCGKRRAACLSCSAMCGCRRAIEEGEGADGGWRVRGSFSLAKLEPKQDGVFFFNTHNCLRHLCAILNAQKVEICLEHRRHKRKRPALIQLTSGFGCRDS